MMSSPGYRGPAEISYLFIDGAYLAERLKSFGELWFDEPAEIHFQTLGQGFTKVFYYDSLPVRDEKEDEATFQLKLTAKEALFDQLRSISGWHVSEGLTKRRRKQSTQKEVDILIAVDMLTHTYRKNMHRLTFIAGDQDFRPLIDAVVRDGMYVTLWYASNSIAKDLKDTADSTKELDLYTLHGFLTQEFRERHPLPLRVGRNERVTGQMIERGYVDDFNSACIFKSLEDDTLTIMETTPIQNNYYSMSLMGNLPFLKRVHKHLYGPCEWSDINQ
jgi:uncharacterized LabA/DUF88 family protein